MSVIIGFGLVERFIQVIDRAFDANSSPYPCLLKGRSIVYVYDTRLHSVALEGMTSGKGHSPLCGLRHVREICGLRANICYVLVLAPGGR